MFEDDAAIARAIEDGSYFEQARKWYSVVYLSIISERYFFIVLTTLAVLTSLIALTAVARLMPLNPRIPYLYLSHDAYNTLPEVRPVKTSPTQDIDDAFRRYFLVQYVERREGYSSRSIERRIGFVRANSDADTFNRYSRSVDGANPRSPVQRYGSLYTLQANADPNSLVITPVNGEPGLYEATIDYKIDLYSQEFEKEGNYRANIGFTYKDLIVDQSDAKDEGAPFHITPMAFKVVSYAVSQAPVSQ